MRFIMTVVEQLDRAAAALETDHPINNRLALILIDNATELLIHRQCVGRLKQDDMVSGLCKAYQSLNERRSADGQLEFSDDLKQDVMTQGQRRSARGEYFEPKLKVLRQMGDLNSEESQFIKIAHNYRNELYHVGLNHDNIIGAIAGRYFLLSCNLFVRLGERGFFGPTFSSNDEYSDVGKRYLPMRDGRIAPWQFDKEKIADKLRSALPDDIPDLAQTLACDARKSVKVIVRDFEILVRDNPFGYNAEEMLENAQWQYDLAKTLEKQEVDGLWIDPNYRAEFIRVASTLEADWERVS